MNTDTDCLGCGEPFDWGEERCPACGWEVADWRERGRHGLAEPGHGEPEDDGPGAGGGGLGGLGPIR
ncbi:hypothetical protein [Haloparvum sedimenti]|uniref:hypothetical protein n=1 Tax=Haloparvum sedimenti TaxID=1678448 RepID=UPI00071E86B9|nr:hypothetical protein [Haloparvum sedimenti]